MNSFIFLGLVLIVAITFFLVWYFKHDAREKERRLLIEKDLDISQIPERPRFEFHFPWLKIGVLAVCGSLGMIITGLLVEMNFFGMRMEPLLVMGGIILFLGIGFIISAYTDNSGSNRNA